MTIKTLLILDNTYPEAYQSSTLKDQGIGGTESSVIKTAQILSHYYRVYVAQKNRKTTLRETQNLSFICKKEIYKLNPDFIIVLRKFPLLNEMHKAFPKAQLFLWIHTYKNYEYVFKKFRLCILKVTIICNSYTHQMDTDRVLNKTILARIFNIFSSNVKVVCCYNPISKPTVLNEKRNLNKLLFFSSPNKGLDQILKSYDLVKKVLPEMKLYIANPGYKNNKLSEKHKDIVVLGSLPHKQMMLHVQQSLCVFYPQNTFAETFGLIYAEANAYGTPVLAHDIGSAKEILDNNNVLIDANNIENIIETIQFWQKSFPTIAYNKDFSNENIASQWKRIL